MIGSLVNSCVGQFAAQVGVVYCQVAEVLSVFREYPAFQRCRAVNFVNLLFYSDLVEDILSAP